MIITAWYHVSEKLPKDGGYYLCMVGSMMTGGNQIKYCRYYPAVNSWRNNEGTQNVAFWTSADPKNWYWSMRAGQWPDSESSSCQIAKKNLEDAYEQYMIISELSKKENK